MTHRPTRSQLTSTLTLAMIMGLALMAPPAAADHHEKPKPTYTRVALWEVDRNDWDAFAELFEKYDKPIMEKLMADGHIVEWGIDSMSLHKPEGYTHSTWFTAESMGKLEKALNAYIEAGREIGDDVDAKFNAMVGRHRDFIARNEVHRSVATNLDSGYFMGLSVVVGWEHSEDFHAYYKNRIAPVYETLIENGDVVAYGLSTEEITTMEPGWHQIWYVTPTPDGIDAVDAAFDADWGDMDEEGRRARWLSIMHVVKPETKRNSMSYLIAGGMKAR